MNAPRIVIVGGGFSGIVTAARLLQQAKVPLHVVLLNRSGPTARGVAYGTHSSRHVLNVPAGRMSAYPEDEDSFVRFACAHVNGVTAGSFVARRLYGEYLAALLAEAEREAGRSVTLERVVAEAADIQVHAGRRAARVVLSDGRTIDADRVVLALGNYPPADPPLGDARACESPRYVRDPWAPGALSNIRAGESVLMIGSGLTMLDIALDLHSMDPSRRMIAISRRGLLPLSHRAAGAPPRFDHCPPQILDGPPTARAHLRAVRSHIRELSEEGVDWREVIASLRPITPKLWQRLQGRERARFLRHVRPYWEVHRHRCAPELGNALQRLMTDKTLTVLAGRIQHLAANAEEMTATVRLRGATASRELTIAHVVNCTGPASDTRTLSDPVFRTLREHGVLQPDALGLGIEVADDGALLDRNGVPSRVLYHVGPLLRGKYWECTAVPELRIHCARMARTLLETIEPSRED